MALTDIDRPASAANIAPRSALYELVAQYNALAAKFEALLEKLDADSGDTGGDSDYESEIGVTKRITLSGTAPTAS